MNLFKRCRAAVLVLVIALALSACAASQPAKEVDLSAVMDGLVETYDLREMMTLTRDDLMEIYGIAPEDVAQCAIRWPMDSITADEIALFEAVSDEAAARVEEKLNARLQAKLNETRDYLPDQYEKIEKCSVKTKGRFVALIVFDDVEAMTADYEKALS